MKVKASDGDLAIELGSEDETALLGRAIADVVEPGVVIGLVGPLGAGKTRLVRAIAEAMGALPAAIASPTFVLIQEYAGRIPIYHFDAYRLRSREEFEDLGFAEYLGLGGLCLVEWADRVRSLLPADCWMIEIEPTGPATRSVRCEFPCSAREASERLAERLKRATGFPSF
jgi:tRNA threonylcarbamoyladenosine biosynthesis protein TsaE